MPILPDLGRLERLYVLDFGLFRPHKLKRDTGVPGFLLVTDTGKHILFDTGFPPGYAADAASAARLDGLDATGEVTKSGPEYTIAGQLAKIGLTPADIDLVILSHSHLDHVGGLPEVAHAPIVMTRTERANPRPLYHGDARPLEWPEAEYILIDEETEICDGLILVPTPGHTLGHVSALLVLPKTGPAMIMGDALERFDQLMNGFDHTDDEALANESADRLLELAKQGAELIIYGHCPGQWLFIAKAPDFYD